MRELLAMLHLQFAVILEAVMNQLRHMGRRWWMRPWLSYEMKDQQGDFLHIFLYYKLHDTEKFYDLIGMTPPQFQNLYDLVENDLTKHSYRTPLDPQLRLGVTLTYFSSGDSIKGVARQYRIGESTLYGIIPEVSVAIYEALQEYIALPSTDEEWISITDQFRDMWNFPLCAGAIDTKQVEIQKPPGSGSRFYNYTRRYTLGVMTLCDAHKRFLWANIGSLGSLNDAGVFHHCDLRDLLESGELRLPIQQLPGTNIHMRSFLLGDPGFPLNRYLLTPYSRLVNLTPSQTIFNYRQSRARRIVECAYGLLRTKWRIFAKALGWSVDNCERIIHAILCLHNYLITLEIPQPEEERRYYRDINIVDEQQLIFAAEDDLQGNEIREILREYFISPMGVYEGQYEAVNRRI